MPPRHQPSEASKATVKNLAQVGCPHEIIAVAIGVKDVKTLKKHYRPLLDEGKVNCLKRLFYHAHKRMEKSDAVLIFLLKTQAGLRETEPFSPPGDKPRRIEFRVTGKGERIRRDRQNVDDDE